MSAASGLTLEALTARVAELEVTVKTLTHKLAHQSIHPLSDMMLEMPMKTFLASLSLVALGAIFLTFFSGVFVGPAVFKWLGRDPITVTRFLTAGVVLILFLILFDAQHWHKRKICCNTGNFWTMMFSIVAVNTFIVGALLAIERYPSYPIAIAIAAFPVLAIFLKKCLLKEMGGGMAGNKATTVMVGGDNGCMEDSATASSTSRERNVSVDAMAMKKANKLGNATDPEALEQMADEIHQSYQKIAAYALITRTFLFLAVMTMIVWIAWLAAYDIWAFDAEARELLGGNPNTNCSATHEDDEVPVEDKDGDFLTCKATFLLWSSPLILFCVSIVNAIVFALLGAQAKSDSLYTHEGVPKTHSATKTVIMIAIGLVLILWCTASIAGAGMSIAHDVEAIVGAAAIALGITVVLSAKRAASKNDEISKRLNKHFRNEWVQALLVFTGLLPFLFYCAFSFVRQTLRRLGRGACICDPPEYSSKNKGSSTTDSMETAGAPPKPAHRRLTLVGKTCTGILKAVGLAKSKTQVLQKVQLLCYAAWLMLFGSTLTFVGLSGLIMWLETMHPAVVAVLFLGIGIFMFLIPIVPGLAVYLTGGILIVQIYWKNVFGENEFGFYMAIIFATGLCYVMKIMAHVLQQKIFGELMGQSVMVRAKVGVNSNLIKAIKFELMKPGMSVAKVCIMCGGPDWPTSVLCGILRNTDKEAKMTPRIKTPELCMCLAPMICIIGPTVMAAAFQLRTGKPFSAVGGIAMMACTIVQVVAGGMATHYINTAMSDPKCKKMIEEEVDQKVAEYDALQETKAREYAMATSFDTRLNWFQKFLLVLGTALQWISAFMLMFASSYLFQNFDLAKDKVTDVLCLSATDSCPFPFVKTPGWAALGMLVLGIVFNKLFDLITPTKLLGESEPQPDTRAQPAVSEAQPDSPHGTVSGRI